MWRVLLAALLSLIVGHQAARAAEYRTYDEVRAALSSLATGNPGIARYVPSIGTSIEGRSIPAIKITKDPQKDEPNKSDVLFVGGHHAREWIGVEVTLKLAEYLVNNYATNSTVRALVDSREIWIVPIVNPDGYVYTRALPGDRLWRKNRHPFAGGVFGVDLNRNYDFAWGTINDSHNSFVKTDPVYIGESAFSEPETTAIKNFIQSRESAKNPISRLIDYHNYSQLVLYPWGNTKDPAPDNALLKKIAEDMRDRINAVAGAGQYTAEQGSDLYATAGSIDDWAYGEKGTLAFTIELRPKTSNPGFELPADQIDRTFAENLPAALYFIGLTRGRSMDFEGAQNNQPIRSTIAGLKFSTTAGFDWIYGDERTPGYNVQPSPDASGPYASNQHGFAWLGPNQGQGRIDFTDPNEKTVGFSYSSFNAMFLDAYDASNALIQRATGPGNLGTGQLGKLSVTGNIAYVIVHDAGNFWLIDDLFVTDGLAEAQALVPGKFARKLELLETFTLGQSKSFSFFARQGEDLKIVVGWPGSSFRVRLSDPQGQVARDIELPAPPITIEHRAGRTGTWTVNITATVLNQPEPVSLIVGSFDAADSDGDGIPNAIDNCPNTKNPDQKDTDGDGVGDVCDNCRTVSNANQRDVYPSDGAEGPGNGIGDACEIVGDLDHDGVVDQKDINILLKDLNKPVSASACGFACDMDGDKRITVGDARKLSLLCTRARCATR